MRKPASLYTGLIAIGLLTLVMACAESGVPTSIGNSVDEAASATPAPTSPIVARAAIPPSVTQIPKTPSAVERVLAATPLSFGSIPLEFSDFAGTRDAFNYQGDLSNESFLDFLSQDGTEGRFVYGPLSIPTPLQVGSGEQMGLPVAPYLAFDLGIWDFRGIGEENPTYLNIQGRYAAAEIGSKLAKWESEDRGKEYDALDYLGQVYYAMYADYEDDIFCCPLRFSTFNRIALTNDWLLASLGTDMLEALFDLRSGVAPSLIESKSHRQLAEAVGEGLLGGVFRKRTVVEESLSHFASFGSSPIERYLEEPFKWENLSPFGLSLTGYRFVDGREEIVIALRYSDPHAAKGDKAELERRWNGLVEDFASGGEPVPVTSACGPFTTKLIEGQDHSILIGKCPLQRGEFPNALLDQPYLWKNVPHWLLYPAPSLLEKPSN